MISKISGIYKFTNKINGKSYIGCSIDIDKRYKYHIKYGKSVLNRAFGKYGSENFTFEILLKCPSMCFDYWEKHYILKYNSVVPNGYNIESGGYFSKEIPIETRIKISNSKKGKRQSKESNDKRRITQTGKPHHSEEYKKELSIRKKGNTNTLGKKIHSEESKEKIRESNRTRWMTPEEKLVYLTNKKVEDDKQSQD